MTTLPDALESSRRIGAVTPKLRSKEPVAAGPIWQADATRASATTGIRKMMFRWRGIIFSPSQPRVSRTQKWLAERVRRVCQLLLWQPYSLSDTHVGVIMFRGGVGLKSGGNATCGRCALGAPFLRQDLRLKGRPYGRRAALVVPGCLRASLREPWR